MAFVEWDESCSVGISLIDKQHQRLFELINNFHEATTNLDAILQDLLSYVDFHFKTEEKFFKEFGYEYTEEHKKEHKYYEDKVAELYRQYTENKTKEKEVGLILEEFIKDWIMHHIKISDKRYAQCFLEHGLR